MKIKLADFVFEFEIKNKKLYSHCLERYEGFLTKESPDFKISAETLALKKNPSEVRIISNQALEIKRGDFLFLLKEKKGCLKLRPSVYSFDSFLRIFSSFLSSKKDMALVHGALSEKDKILYAFLGKSGAGKSTISKILKKKGFNILSDELFFIRADKKNIKAYSSPFWGEMKGKGKYVRGKIKGLYFIKKSDINYKKDVDFSNFYPLFLRCLMNFSKEKKIVLSYLKTARRIFRNSKPSFLFFSKKDNSFVKLL
ncbi:MAG: hypothetical protein AB1637_04505 [Elusimicrobiota bacterium]